MWKFKTLAPIGVNGLLSRPLASCKRQVAPPAFCAAYEEGYILAAALACLFAISLVAAALVTFSGDQLARIRRLEQESERDLALQSAITVAAAQLTQDPRRRHLVLAADSTALTIDETTVDVRVTWEGQRVDVNSAEREAMSAALHAIGADPSVSSQILIAAVNVQASGRAVQLLDVLDLSPQALACANEVLTPFGGQKDLTDGAAFKLDPVGQGAPGSRIRIDAWLPGQRALIGQTAVIQMTGDTSRPYVVLDWRKSFSIGPAACRASV